jgi:hypothetical protein
MMALRIGGGKTAAPVEEELPIEEAPVEEAPIPEEAPVEEAPMEEPMGGGMVDQITVNYLGPEMGPFSCGSCKFFMQPSSCQIVQGQVEADGICNVFTPMDLPDEGMPEEEMPMEEEAPVEEPLPEEEPTA